MYIAVEGIDGAGKTTALTAIKEWAVKEGIELTQTREPGGTFFAEELRTTLLQKKELDLTVRDELMLMNVARTDVIRNLVLPTLGEGGAILSDRCLLSSDAYQVTNVTQERLFNALHLGVAEPDVVIMLSCSYEEATRRRAVSRGYTDRMEDRPLEEQLKVVGRYENAVNVFPYVVEVDSSGSIEETSANVKSALAEFHRGPRLHWLMDTTLATLTYEGKVYPCSKELLVRRINELGYRYPARQDGLLIPMAPSGNSTFAGVFTVRTALAWTLRDAVKEGLLGHVDFASCCGTGEDDSLSRTTEAG